MIRLTVAALLLAAAAALPVAPAADKAPVQFRQDGTFKVVVFTDTQVGSFERDVCLNVSPDERPCDAYNTTRLMGRILDLEEPDMVVLTGDIVTLGAREADYRQVLEPIIDRGLPWASCFGNHDDDSSAFTRELLGELEVSMAVNGSLFRPGPPGVEHVSNYVVEVGSSADPARPAWAFFLLDSGDSDASGLGIGGYDWIRPNQIQWYLDESGRIKAEWGDIPTGFFYHIPTPEFLEVWEGNFPSEGEKYEGVGSARINSGLVAATIQQGTNRFHVVGHDHINNYRGTFADQLLLYGRATGYTTYGRNGFQRGARVLEIKEGSGNVLSWQRLADGTVAEW